MLHAMSAVDEERRNAGASATLAASAAAAQLNDAVRAQQAEMTSAVAAARDEARAQYMQSHAAPAVEELARSLPSEERRNAMCIIASCLAPQWQLATLAAGIEVRCYARCVPRRQCHFLRWRDTVESRSAAKRSGLPMQDSVHRLHGEDGGAATAAYRGKVTAIVAHLCPEGVPGVWMPTEAQQASWERALAAGGTAQPDDWTPQGGVGDATMRSASALRGAIWGGQKTFMDAADLQFGSGVDNGVAKGKQP